MSAKEIHAIIKRVALPILRDHGFKGRYPKLTRERVDCVDFVEYYAHGGGNDFYCEFALSPNWIRSAWVSDEERTVRHHVADFTRAEFPAAEQRINPRSLGSIPVSVFESQIREQTLNGLRWLETHSTPTNVRLLAEKAALEAPEWCMPYFYIAASFIAEQDVPNATKALERLNAVLARDPIPRAAFIKAWPKVLGEAIADISGKRERDL